MNDIRPPVVAGQFYPGDGATLKMEVRRWLDQGVGETQTPFGVMLPHAGYVYCGEVIGKTLHNQALPSRLVILCPNHTGYGTPFSVWSHGAWATPLGLVPIDEAFTADLLRNNRIFAPDKTAHLREHSIEVLLPFLQMQVKDPVIVPICIGTQNVELLKAAASLLANCLKLYPDTALIVSSDMNHYENEAVTLKKDEAALEKALAGDGDGLLETVKGAKITMCGAAPLAMALFTAKELGGVEVELVEHITSAKASGDKDHTVGYAGLRLFKAA